MSEESAVEIPGLRFLETLGYTELSAAEVNAQRESLERVLLKDTLVDALMRINHVPRETALSVYNELAGLSDNEAWFKRLRGQASKKVSGESTSTTIKLLDFDALENNTWGVTRQFYVKGGGKVIEADLVVFVNGIPLVVIEAKDLTGGLEKGIAQIRRYETHVDALFAPNAFNIVTTGALMRYAATHSPLQYWFDWPESTFPGNAFAKTQAMERGFTELLTPARLLDLIAHFIVFERDASGQKVVKKICRYQQLRAVNKMVERVIDGEHRKGLIWHTQGSGKSLTMVFAALKLKFHRGIEHARLKNPNILVVTDRKDLDAQITGTFRACGLPNPKHARSTGELRALIEQESPGRVITSTIFKFDGEDPRFESGSMRERQAAMAELAAPQSANWILLVDECHRTQEELLGAYLRATFPDAFFFGFTGTPVKKNDKDTYANFGAPGEGYLDKYGIDEAVRDGATVKVLYTARLTDWHLEDAEIDAAFERYFAAEDDETRRKLKERGVTRSDLARLPSRIAQIAADIWQHFRAHIHPDGYKAQIVTVDRRAVAEHKKALDAVIARWYVEQKGLSESDARQRATTHSAAIYSANANDAGEVLEDESVRGVLRFQLSEAEQKDAIQRFRDPESELYFLIVCDKLLTGFDAPVEQAMYLDKSLRDHNLLQAITRTNRRFRDKPYGLIVDYFGVSQNLQEALSAYRADDVQNAMRPESALLDDLRDAHRKVMAFVDPSVRHDAREAVLALGGVDRYYDFCAEAKPFIALYSALMPDPAVIPFAPDLKLVTAMIPVGKLQWEQEEPDLSMAHYSAKIRQMLTEHLEVTGIRELCRMRPLSDPDFYKDFDESDEADARDLETAAVRKTAELKKIIGEKMGENAERYATFSERLKELIASFQLGLFDAADKLDALEEVARDLQAEDAAHQGSRLGPRAYGIWSILKANVPNKEDEGDAPDDAPSDPYKQAFAEGSDRAESLSALEALAEDIAALYQSDDHAPVRWQDKDSVRQNLRQQVRHMLVRRKVAPWQGLPEKIETFALKHYPKS
ncbi:type I restriction endonuclease subunit R [Bradymonas sediminis]|uniref:Type I restriction enzyme endonuclease subunit n=1 Tax=Bradymonas sediminis TaxID=1548548 RepID=A0A2Z4FHZ7_9DELT|nr:HsdR family type I site-specific deoxyribonuclease [Bradymonas sediminis]AWV88520.1 restriction endonuclease subunit R [Bradymonas sediminis]TDP77657.1 type I restriction enzyme R subunit [Bradymonas sediminis]